MHQQFAIDAFVALSSQTPDSVRADGTVGSLLQVMCEGRERIIMNIPGEAAMATETCTPAGTDKNRQPLFYDYSPPHSPLINTKTNSSKSLLL